MSFFKKKPTEHELELIVMRAATIAKAEEIDTSQLTSNDEIAAIIAFAFKEVDRKADANSQKYTLLGVQALLTEGTFLEELIEYQLAHPGQRLPNEFRTKMLAAMQKSVTDFLAQR